MVWGGRVHAAAFVAAALMVCCVGLSTGPARAGDDDDEPTVVLLSGRDVWFNGAFVYGGLLWSPDGVEHEGFTFKALISGGLYRYDASDLGGERVIGSEIAGQLLPGWRIKRGSFEAKIFVGPELQRNRLWPDDPGNQLRGSKFGVRLASEFWNEPTANSMLAADASGSTIATSFSARAAVGWRVLDMFYAGPETQIYGGDGYRQLRFGVHFTSFREGDTEWSAAAGWAIDSEQRSSPYFRLGFMASR